MNQYDSFIIDSYSYDSGTGTITLRYNLDGQVLFTETLTLPTHAEVEPERREEFDNALFALHVIGGVSYYKTCIPKTIEVQSGKLSSKDARFWQSVYENGLGEFFYTNDIDFRGLVQFPASDEGAVPSRPEGTHEKAKRVLVPIGGGKDSLVTAEILRKAGYEVTLFRMGQHPAIDAIATAANLPLLTVKRALSAELFKLNEDGALNGHVPITAYLSCVSMLIAILYGFDAVALSSERSANEGNVEFKGMEINHQWSKSLMFERAFQSFVARSVSEKVSYFSLLRPMSELRIVGEFCNDPQYLELATSCNKNWKILSSEKSGLASRSAADSIREAPLRQGYGGQPPLRGGWCGTCPKCAFVFALYAAFLPKEKLMTIFGKNLFEDETLLPLYRELLGLEGIKPFECVGTADETKAAFLLAAERGDLNDTPVMKMFMEDARGDIADADSLIKRTLALSSEHVIPDEFLNVIPR